MDYKFKFIRKVDIIIEADDEVSAWAQAMQLNADLYAAGWEIVLDDQPPVEPPIDQGPVEVDDWDAPFDDL
jgi:hypothetical protein